MTPDSASLLILFAFVLFFIPAVMGFAGKNKMG